MANGPVRETNGRPIRFRTLGNVPPEGRTSATGWGAPVLAPSVPQDSQLGETAHRALRRTPLPGGGGSQGRQSTGHPLTDSRTSGGGVVRDFPHLVPLHFPRLPPPDDSAPRRLGVSQKTRTDRGLSSNSADSKTTLTKAVGPGKGIRRVRGSGASTGTRTAIESSWSQHCGLAPRGNDALFDLACTTRFCDEMSCRRARASGGRR